MTGPRILASVCSQVVLCMIDLKVAPLVHDPCYRDGVVDVIGYAALLPEVQG